MKKLRILALLLAAMMVVTACGNKADAGVKEPVGTPVETVVEKIYLRDYKIPEMKLTVNTDKVSELTEDELEEGKKLAVEYMKFTIMNFEEMKDATTGNTMALYSDVYGKHMSERLTQIFNEIIDGTEEDDYESTLDIVERREDGSQLRRDHMSKSIGEVIKYKNDGDTIAYIIELVTPIKEYGGIEDEEGTFIKNEIEPTYVFLNIEGGELKIDGYGSMPDDNAKYLTEEELLKYELAKPRVLEAPKYRTKQDVEELGGFYWGADEQTWDENKVGYCLKSIYPNKANNTVSYVMSLYNTTDTVVKGKYGIRVNSLRIQYQEAEGAEEMTYVADLGNTQYDIVELNIEPGKSILYEFIAEDAEWFNLLKNIGVDYDNGIIYDYYYNQNVSVQKIIQ